MRARSQIVRRVANELGPRLSNATIFFHETVSQRLGVNATDTKCLGLLWRAAGPMTAGDLAEVTGLTTGAVTAIIDRLEAKGLVRRKRDAKDRRKVFVELHKERMKLVTPLYEGLRQSIEALVGRYKGPELALIGDFLEKAAAVLENEARRLRRK